MFKKKLFDFALTVLVLFALVVGNALKEIWSIDSDIKEHIDTTLLELDKADLELQSKGYSLDILSAYELRTDNEINEMLLQVGNKNGAFIYTHGRVGVYTMSAQGIDGEQHLVHTYLEGYKPFDVENVMMPLYVLSQRKQYMLDGKQYKGRMEVWQSSRQAFYYPRGDCEDHAIALADWLIEMGEDARVVLGDWSGGGHAWVLLFKNGKEYLLEATKKSGLTRTKPYPIALIHTDYHPEYMFNREYFWGNEGSKFTTRYSGKKWKKKSRFYTNL